MNNGNSSNKINLWLIIGMLLLLGLNGYQWYRNSLLSTQNLRYETEMLDLQKAQADLDAAFESSLQSLEEMRSDNKELNNLIESQKRELKSQKDKINNLIWTKRELSKAREEIQNLNNQAANYVAEIARLKEENSALAGNNATLRNENNVLSQQITAEINEKKAIAAEKAELAVAKQELTVTNKKLSSKVDMANAIKINYLKVQGYKVKDNGKRRKKRRARNINMLEICFTTETNLVTAAGDKEFQFRIIDPLGETLLDDLNAGVLENKLDGTKVRYTTLGTISYNNEDTNACMEWNVDNSLSKGKHKVEMYNNGFLVGTGDFNIK